MFTTAFALALPLLAIASPYRGRRDNGTEPCSTGSIQCCTETDIVKVLSSSGGSCALFRNVINRFFTQPYSNVGSTLLTLAGLDEHPDAYIGDVAASCSTGIGILNGPTCSGTPMCCSTNVRSVMVIRYGGGADLLICFST